MERSKYLYVPILKTKAGERWALSHLPATSKAKIRPLFELHEHKDKLIGDHLSDVCDALAAVWSTDRPFYLDAIWLHGDAGDPGVLATVFEAVEDQNLQAIPVVRTTFDDATLDQVQSIVEENSRGYLLRITRADLDQPRRIRAVVDAIGVPKNKADLLLDYRGHAMSLADDVERCPDIGDWREFIAAAGVFPRSLTHLPLHTWQRIDRTDWSSWRNGVQAEIPRVPIYSDYTMRAPGAPADFGAPSVNLRYTTDDAWMVQMGGKFKDGAAPEIHEMCRELVASEEYSGADFSAGDDEINRVTDDAEGPGGPTQWLQWCVSHHLESVLHQLA